MTTRIFVSYRRSDSQHAAFAIVDRLRWAFGQDAVFFDCGSIEGGSEWSESIKNALHSARVVVVVIGADWLRVADKWGRRRLDDPNDWVRQEVCTSLDSPDQYVIPVYLEGAAMLCDLALDVPLQRLTALQAVKLSNDLWEAALEQLISLIATKGKIQRIDRGGDRNPNGSMAKPKALQDGRKVLSDEEVRLALSSLSFWHLRWSPHEWGVNQRAQEITKVYEFPSFDEAIRFMAFAARQIDAWIPPHHPRWGNQWKVVTASFSTWDVGCRVTELDIEAAMKLDVLYLDRPRTPVEA